MVLFSSARGGSAWILVCLLGTTQACAHRDPSGAKGRADQACADAGECAALRQQVRRLEARVRQLEDTNGEPSDPGVASERIDSDLPVVKLTPTTRSGARTLERSPAIDSTETEGLPSEPVAVEPDDGTTRVSSSMGADSSSPSEHEPNDDVPPSRRYRLVGSRLVDLTKGSRESERRRRSQGGAAGSEDDVVRAYKAAMQVYRNGAYADAERSFAELARTHPDHAYADNALYWQGESAYDQARYADALAAFTDVVERYGGGNKAADALLKIGLCYGRLGDRENAYDVLTQLIAAYPRSNASRLAKERLSEYSGAGE